jgi:four helix bundle protein
MHTYYFEKLEVWQNARIFSKDVYVATTKFPDIEKFGIINQIRRATLSIAANIAEGMSRSTNKDKLRFINQSYSSAIEVLNFFIIANDLGFLGNEEYKELREKLEKITNQLSALSNKLKE